jgi:radical SAM superfamily enzyme
LAAHIINGLPLEDRGMMMETAKAVADLDVQGIKSICFTC